MSKETLKLEKVEAIKLYQSAPDWFKKVLKGTFGENCFSGKIIDRLFTVQDVLNERGKKLEDICRLDDRADKKARDIMEYVIEVVNEGFKADYDNGKQKKWHPIFEKTPSGFRFTIPIATVRVRIRVSARAFAMKMKKNVYTFVPNLNSWLYTMIY